MTKTLNNTVTILDAIVAQKREEIALFKAKNTFKSVCAHMVRGKVLQLASGNRFSEALRGKDRVSLIAEVKKASPSEGVICADFDPVALAQAYERAGAVAISVLTDETFFQGSLDDLRQVASAVSVPVLRKDFIIDEIQIKEAAQAGASAVLLIATILDDRMLYRLRELAESLGMEALVEVHSEVELRRALASGATIIGINNRDLKTFKVNLDVTLELVSRISNDVVVVSESGFLNRRDVARVRGKVDGVLIGTSLVRCPDVSLKIHELFMNRPLLKICGIRDVHTARACEVLGVDLLGFNFIKTSPRFVSPDVFCGQRFCAKTVGLFCNESLGVVNQIARELDLDLVQLHGDETADYCARVERPVIKSFLPGQDPFDGVIPLFDLPKGAEGVIEPPRFEGFLNELFGLAGGLTPENVRNAVGESCPLFVDVARGVETNGQIELDKVQQFINQLESC